ncbi:hypothetical protein DOTSEDRAFT_77415 [Dothistroma septosporum NZE10]|uniref:Uncharacterized protein n=1 Tax=Dothistroma septosporum (strain NZE10 / CBS 128990) TaxID=675120 RepID=N1Q3X4_DOTSN|nr:hypothetical protein DOTSEDRAFT_77415 [Dothistroma septosporum NZE10]
MEIQTLLLVAAVALVVRLTYTLYTTLTSSLRSIPGPLFARFTKLWYFNSIYKGQAHWDNINLHRQHAGDEEFFAPIVRLGPNMYSISRPEKAVYGIGSKMPKSKWYEGWKHPSPDRWSIFTDQNIKRHAETRRNFQGMYAMSSLLHYEPFVEDAGEVLRTRLGEMAMKGEEGVNLHHWLQCYAFDVIGNITFSRRFGFLDEGKDIDRCMASLESNMVYATLVGVYYWAHPYLHYFLERFFPSSGAAARSYLTSFISKRVTERESHRESAKLQGKRPGPDTNAPRDFLDLAMDAEQDPEKQMTRKHVFMMLSANVVAGSDTTAISLSSIVWHLTSNPPVLAKLRQELDNAIAEGTMTKERISFKQSQDLPYLQACIKEALRLCAATGLPLWRVVQKGGAEILGQHFPEGTEVGINSWVAHYDEDIWGRDAKQYRPERWIEAQGDAERLRVMENFYMPFGLGSRTCIGRHISFLEMCKVIPMIVSNFDFVLTRPTKEFKTENFWPMTAQTYQVHLDTQIFERATQSRLSTLTPSRYNRIAERSSTHELPDLRAKPSPLPRKLPLTG